jgi:CheY-like chemotaxis protein
MQSDPPATLRPGARSHRAPYWPRRVLLAGGDSVVSRALLVFLRKEGFDAAVVSEDPTAWGTELSGRPFAGGAARVDADVIIVSPHVTGPQRQALCRRVRDRQALHAVPIVALRDAGDQEDGARAGSIGGHGGQPAALSPVPPSDGADASIAWPFRLREVLGAIDTLTSGPPRAVSA